MIVKSYKDIQPMSEAEKINFKKFCETKLVEALNHNCKNNRCKIIDSNIWYDKNLARFYFNTKDANEILKEFHWKYDHLFISEGIEQIRKYYFKRSY